MHIANAFSYMRIIEEWGSGIPRMFDEFSRYGLSEPELVDMDGDFRVNFYRKGYTDKNVGVNVGVKLNSTQKKILNLIKDNPTITLDSIARKFAIHKRTVERNIKTLKEKNVIDRIGSDKDGKWIVKTN